ncbi:hypothetical protein BDV96DRAFT_570704 [Lophiotrema nucula]|uniref:Extracellular membrane protein CFEM domain-containing protein n=1 Tax=Lophiotrema nucula TaxID=690887 RepID=A0A6A5ZDV8_9PLEO|nr:hypothetical protein BDV96DRAFT_570704 [Lophiotrema nucula]
MFSKTIFAFAFIAASQLVAAIPPACLLGALNTYEKPGDISAVCKEKDASATIAKFCGDSTDDALSAFADTCNKAGVKVSTEINTTATASSSKSTGTGSVSVASGTVTGATTLATAIPTGSAGVASPSQIGGAGNGTFTSGTATGSPAQSTGAAGRMEVAGAALLAGVVAAFL